MPVFPRNTRRAPVCGLPQNAVVVGTPTRARHPPTGRRGSPVRCAYVRCRAARRAQAARRLARLDRPRGHRRTGRAARCSTAAVGASRTDSAYPRFLAQSRASDVLVSPLGGPGVERLRRRGRRAAWRGRERRGGRHQRGAGDRQGPPGPERHHRSPRSTAATGGRWTSRRCWPAACPAVAPPGRSPSTRSRPGELHLHVGSVLTMAAEGNSPHSRPVKLTEHVVGIFVTRGSVLPVTYIDRDALVLASPALYRELGPQLLGLRRRVRDAQAGRVAGHVQRGRGKPGQAIPEHRPPGAHRRRDDAGGDHRAADPPAGDRPGAVRARPCPDRTAHRRPGRGQDAAGRRARTTARSRRSA